MSNPRRVCESLNPAVSWLLAVRGLFTCSRAVRRPVLPVVVIAFLPSVVASTADIGATARECRRGARTYREQSLTTCSVSRCLSLVATW
jgi:hypothetical protein